VKRWQSWQHGDNARSAVSVGPSRWAEIAPAAGGQRQSPIAIRAAEAQFSPTLRDRPLVVSYNPVAVNKLVNNGQSLQVCVDGNDSSASPQNRAHTQAARFKSLLPI